MKNPSQPVAYFLSVWAEESHSKGRKIYISVHCDKSDKSRRLQCYSTECRGEQVVYHGIVRGKKSVLYFVIQLNLGKLPAIAENTPRFNYFNLLLNIVIIFKCYYYIIIMSLMGIALRSSLVEIRHTNNYTTKH